MFLGGGRCSDGCEKKGEKGNLGVGSQTGREIPAPGEKWVLTGEFAGELAGFAG